MNRFIVLIFLYISSLILFLAFNQYGFIDSIILGIFILSILWYVFAQEELPDKKLNVPAVHYYQKSRVNTYGYVMVALLAFLSLSFMLCTQILGIRSGLVILALWLFMLIASYYAAIWSNKNSEALIIDDFIRNNIKIKIEFDLNSLIKMLLSAPLPYSRGALYSLATSDKKFRNVDNELIDAIVYLFIKYQEGTRNKLVPGEIEEVNKK